MVRAFFELYGNANFVQGGIKSKKTYLEFK